MNLIGKVSATERNPNSCDEFHFWIKDDVLLSPFDIVKVVNKLDNSTTYGVVQDIFHKLTALDISATMSPLILVT
jgi:hypothetical protein